MIEFKEVGFSYSDVTVLQHVNFRIDDGDFVGILGPNGGGKSTFLKLALGLLKPTVGSIEMKERRVCYISQVTSISDASFPATVREVVGFGLVGVKTRMSRKEKKNQIDSVLEKLGLKELEHRLVNELSGGQMQRVKIAKAIVSKPSLLVLDEPDAGMDEESHHSLVHLIQDLHQEKVSILFVSHHPHDLEKADRIYFIEDGKMLTYEEELERGHHHASL